MSDTGNKSPMYTAAVIGLGVGEQHARTLAADPRIMLKWLVDHNAGTAQALAETLGAQVGTEADVMADPSVNFVSIASNDNDHADQVVAALAADKHVFVEKPLCRSIEELAAIKKVFAAGRVLGVESNLVLRAAPLYQWLRTAIADGVFGEIYAFDADYLYGRVHKLTEGWRGDIDAYSVMSGGGIHMVDLMLFLLDQRPETVKTDGNQIVTRGTKVAFDDFQSATYRFAGGLIARISANFGCAHHHQHSMRIFGTKATFILDDQGPRMLTLRDSEFHAQGLVNTPRAAADFLPYDHLPKGKGALIPDYLSAIEGGTGLTERAQRNFDLISAIVASDESRVTGQATVIDYV